MKKTTIFDFVQNPRNQGINWHLNFLVDYLPLIDRIFDEVNSSFKNNKTDPVDNTELVDFCHKIAQPNPNTSASLINQLDIQGIDVSILETYQDDPYLENLTFSDAIKLQEIFMKLIQQNRKVVIADILLEDTEAGECYFNGFSNLKNGASLLNDYRDINQYNIFNLDKVAEKFESVELDCSLPQTSISIMIYNDQNGNWSLHPQHGSKKVKLLFTKFEASHAVAFEEVDRLKQQYDFLDKFLIRILNLARKKFNKKYWAEREQDDESDLTEALCLKKIINNADWDSNLSILSWKESDSVYYKKHPDKRNSIYLTMVPSNVLDTAQKLHKIRKKHEFDKKWDFNSTNYRKIVIRLSDHPNDNDYEYDLDYDDFTYYFSLDKIKKEKLSNLLCK